MSVSFDAEPFHAWGASVRNEEAGTTTENLPASPSRAESRDSVALHGEGTTLRTVEEKEAMRRTPSWKKEPQIVARCPLVTPSAKAVLNALRSYSGGIGELKTCWPSIQTLMDCTGLGRDTVCRALRDLEGIKLISRVPRDNMTTIYGLLEYEWKPPKPTKNDKNPVSKIRVPPCEQNTTTNKIH